MALASNSELVGFFRFWDFGVFLLKPLSIQEYLASFLVNSNLTPNHLKL